MTYTLTIGWLYPDLMSTYGDQGNIAVLQKRCEWRGIVVTVVPISEETTAAELEQVDLLFGGGAQDVAQSIVMQDLSLGKGEQIKTMIQQGKPALLICGAYQLAGNSYVTAAGQSIDGLGIFDLTTKSPAITEKRLVGNCHIVIENPAALRNVSIAGFENHGGRTYSRSAPFAHVRQGNGNNGEDHTEGAVYRNAIGSYLHGPLLPSNPEIADWLIATALEIKYGFSVALEVLDDSLERRARETKLRKYGKKYPRSLVPQKRRT